MNIVFKNIDKKIINDIYAQNNKFIINSKNKFISFCIKINNIIISIYKSNTIMIQGSDEKEINIFCIKYGLKNEIIKQNNNHITDNICGCDEVGTGDYFGPIITCCCYVEKNQEKELLDIGIMDSKKINDTKILEIYNKIKNKLKYQYYICFPNDYNNLINKFNNSNIIKALCHNKTISIFNDNNKNLAYKIVMDQFVNKNKYIEYLNTSKQQIIQIDIFETKAESKYLAVAAASIIARAIFIEEMNKMSRKLNFNLIYGSSKTKLIVNQGKMIIKQNKKLCDFAKIHFKSITDQILNKKN